MKTHSIRSGRGARFIRTAAFLFGSLMLGNAGVSTAQVAPGTGGQTGINNPSVPGNPGSPGQPGNGTPGQPGSGPQGQPVQPGRPGARPQQPGTIAPTLNPPRNNNPSSGSLN